LESDFFVILHFMSKNKLKKFDEMATFSNVYQYPYAVLESQGGCPLKGIWRSKVFGNDNPLVLELGCGRGEYAVALAQLFKDKNFIGIDIKGARMWSGAKEALETGLTNVAFLRTNIELLPSFFAADEVSEIWLTFPDPQMKKVNKRLTGARFVSLYRKFLADGGLIHLKTDSNFLFTYTRELIKANSFNELVCTDDLYNSSFTDPILSIQTCYEQQWRERGLNIKYLCFKLNNNDPIVEPEIEIEPDPYRSYNRRRRQETKQSRTKL